MPVGYPRTLSQINFVLSTGTTGALEAFR